MRAAATHCCSSLGSAAPSARERLLEARDAVRAEMRTMLGSLHDILKASMVGDTLAMRDAATRSGLATAADPALEKLLPEGFLQLGVNTHQQFDDLAGALAKGLPRDSVGGRLTRITGNCVSCHATYQRSCGDPAQSVELHNGAPVKQAPFVADLSGAGTSHRGIP